MFSKLTKSNVKFFWLFLKSRLSFLFISWTPPKSRDGLQEGDRSDESELYLLQLLGTFPFTNSLFCVVGLV